MTFGRMTERWTGQKQYVLDLQFWGYKNNEIIKNSTECKFAYLLIYMEKMSGTNTLLSRDQELGGQSSN
jgi:hypothetical protein